MKRAVFAAVAMVALATTQSHAENEFDGTLLRDLCVSSNQHEKLACSMFITGFAYGLSVGTVAQQSLMECITAHLKRVYQVNKLN
jgi:hypothetical protein